MGKDVERALDACDAAEGTEQRLNAVEAALHTIGLNMAAKPGPERNRAAVRRVRAKKPAKKPAK